MEEKILELIKKYKKIIIARHIGGDPDALGATFALKEIILENFKDKEVHVVGASISRFKFFGTHEKMTDEMYQDALLIALDIPDIKRIDIDKLNDLPEWFDELLHKYQNITGYSDTRINRLCILFNRQIKKLS